MDSNTNNNNEVKIFSGSRPYPGSATGDTAYTSADGLKVYIQFIDPDSTGLYPSSGIQSRFRVTKLLAGAATTVTPVATFVDSSKPKLLELQLNSSDKIIDATYSGVGTVYNYQFVKVSYDSSSGLGVSLSDNDATKSFVESFTGLGVSNRTEEANGPVALYAYSSTDGSNISVVFREATPPLFPYTNISGFAVTQGTTPIPVTSAYVLDPSSDTLGKIVRLNLSDTLIIDDNTNPVTLTFTQPTSNTLKLKDSTSVGNYAVEFGGLAVTNLTADLIKPVIIETYTDAIGSTVYVKMSKPTIPSSPGFGFTVYTNGIGYTISSITASNSTYAGNGVSLYTLNLSSTFKNYDILELDYSKPSTNYITDQSLNLNTLDSLDSKLSITNFVTGSYPGVFNYFDANRSYVDENGLDIYVSLYISRLEPVVPATGIQGFVIFVDGQAYPIKSAISLSRSFTEHVKITLYSRIHKDSAVQLAYRAGNLQESNSNVITSFEPQSFTNNSLYESSKYFDIFTWNDNLDNDIRYTFDIDSNTNDLFRKVEIYPNANVILDTEPPKGIAIINRGSSTNTGIKIHKFDAYGAVLEESSTEVDYSYRTSAVIWNFTLSADQDITSFTFRLKRDITILNTGDRINFSVYSHSSINNNPLDSLFRIDSVYFGDLTTSYQDFELTLTDSQSLSKSTTYWIVAELDNLPVGISADPNIIISTHTKSGAFFGYPSTDFTTTYSLFENKTAYYKIVSSNITESPLSSTDIILDIFEKPIRDAQYFGSDSTLQKYELFGDKKSNYILKKLDKSFEDLANPSNDIYPTISKIVIGATASKPKNYILEIKTSVDGNWEKVFDTLCDSTTTDYFVYTFETPISIVEMRLVYKGDYFTVDQLGTLTVAASDETSSVTQAQISHYSDFRDAKYFPNADASGYIGFQDGKTDFVNWNITSLSNAFKKQTNEATSDILASVDFNGKIILASNNKVFTFVDGIVSETTNDQIVSNTSQITCLAVYKNKVYLGTSNGYLYSSYSGDFWTVVNAVDPLNRPNPKAIKPIKSLGVFGDKLFIGTSKGTSSKSTIYVYDGFSIESLKDFADYEFVSSISAYKFNLFAGLGNVYGSSSSSIYKYDGNDWTQTLSSTFDNVEVLSPSTARTSIVAGFRGGEIWELPFVNSLPTSWRKIHDVNSDHIYSISDDSTGEYLFIAADAKTSVYIKSLDTFKTITSFDKTVSSLNKNWKKFNNYSTSYSTDIANNESFTYETYSLQTDAINYNDFSFTGFGSSSRVRLQGAIKAEKDAVYSFKTISNMGLTLSLGGTAVTSSFGSTAISSDQSLVSNRTFTVAENDLIDFDLDAFVSKSTTPSLKLLWNDTTDTKGYQVVPASQFVRSNVIKNILQSSSSYYGVGSDGAVYSFDPLPYESKVRNVYVRFKDEAGNIHGISVDSSGNTYDILTDKISQELYEANGKIYQIKKNDDYSLDTRVIYTPNARDYAIYGPDRQVRESGIYESQPFYVPTLVKWSSLTTLVTNKYQLNLLDGVALDGLDAGTAVKIYVKSGDTRTECLNSTWVLVNEESYINNDTGTPPFSTLTANIASYNGKWLQYKFELISATKNISPEVISTTITYVAGTASYYFTKIFDTSDYNSNAPTIKRGLLTSNELLNNGTITYGYITSDSTADIYDFNKYTPITPNKSFELDTPSNKIKFGILFTSVGNNPSVVYDFAVQLDIGSDDIKFMPTL